MILKPGFWQCIYRYKRTLRNVVVEIRGAQATSADVLATLRSFREMGKGIKLSDFAVDQFQRLEALPAILDFNPLVGRDPRVRVWMWEPALTDLTYREIRKKQEARGGKQRWMRKFPFQRSPQRRR